MIYPTVIDNVLPLEYYYSLNDELTSNWSLNNVSYPGGRRSWGISNNLKTDLPFLSSASYIKLKIKKVLKHDLKLCKIHINGQTTSQDSEFHVDFSYENTWTFVLFCGYNWDVSWGGEFVSYDKKSNKYNYIPFIPNTGVLIPSNWEHYGSAPNVKTDSLRITVAYSYCIPEDYKKILSGDPQLNIFY